MSATRSWLDSANGDTDFPIRNLPYGVFDDGGGARCGVAIGDRILDVACGAGAQTLQATRRIGPGGALVACDISGSMLEHVRHNAPAAGLMNIETVESAAESLAETKSPFDAAISRLGLMLFPKLSSAVGAIGRALKPGAKFAALVLPRRPTIRSSHRQWRSFCDTPTSNRRAPASQPGLFALGGQNIL